MPVVQAKGQPGGWDAHPTRKGQQIQLIEGMSWIWEGLKVPMNVCVVRYPDSKTSDFRYFGFATTDLGASARQVIRTYQVRPEVEEDYRQLKSDAWQVDRFPTVYVLDSKGVIRYKGVRGQELEAAVEELLTEN